MAELRPRGCAAPPNDLRPFLSAERFRCREPSAARTMIAFSAGLSYQPQRLRNVSASVL